MKKMYDAGRIITGLIIALAFFLFPFYWDAGFASKAPEPELTPKAKDKIYVTSELKLSAQTQP